MTRFYLSNGEWLGDVLIDGTWLRHVPQRHRAEFLRRVHGEGVCDFALTVPYERNGNPLGG